MPWYDRHPWKGSGPDPAVSGEDIMVYIPSWGWRLAYSYEGGPWTLDDDRPEEVTKATWWMQQPPDPPDEPMSINSPPPHSGTGGIARRLAVAAVLAVPLSILFMVGGPGPPAALDDWRWWVPGWAMFFVPLSALALATRLRPKT